MWMWAPAIACGNTFVLKPSEKDPSASLLHGRAAEGGRPPGRRLQRRPRRQGRGRRAARAPGRRRGQLRRLDADRALHLRDGHEARQARAGARRREEPHDRAAGRRHRHGRRRGRQRRLRLGRRALHGDLDRRRRRRRGRPARRRDQGAAAEDQGRRRHWSPTPRWGRSITREHRDKVASYIEKGAEQGATVVADGRESAPNGDGFFLGVSLLDDVKPEMDCYRDEIFGPVLGVVRVGDLRRGA